MWNYVVNKTLWGKKYASYFRFFKVANDYPDDSFESTVIFLTSFMS